MKEALFYEKLNNYKVRCFLCMHHCRISNGKRGICGVRENREGALYSLVFGKVVAMHIDPIEKKPLFHVMPSSRSFSIATAGCNFKCQHCQNYDISQSPSERGEIPGETMSAQRVVEEAYTSGCESISYTYTEPTIFLEFALDCSRRAKEKGIKNIFVSNGYASPEAVEAAAPYLDAINIDLKGDDEFYRKICGAKLAPVQETIRLMKKLGVWVEVTTLVIPNHNDSVDTLGAIADFIVSVDDSIPWHVSRFYPTYKMLDTHGTPVETLRKACEIGRQKGLKYVYQGNIPGEGENTYCPYCDTLLIERFGYQVRQYNIEKEMCPECKGTIKGIWGE